MIIGREIKVSIIRLNSDNLWSVVLVLVVGFYGGYLLEGDSLGGLLVYLSLGETIQVGFC